MRQAGAIRILVVDDEASVRGLLVSALTSPECEVFDAEDASEALELARQHEWDDSLLLVGGHFAAGSRNDCRWRLVRGRRHRT